MSQNFVDQVLSDRSEYLKHLNTDLSKNEEIIENTIKTITELEKTAANVQFLGTKVEHTSLIPLGKNIYVNGTITHTGEYYLDKLAFPNSYSVVETLDKTVEMLENKTKTQRDLLKKFEDSRSQIEDRIKLLTGEDRGDLNEKSPEEIVSDKGVAVKVGDLYEILEFE